MRRKTPSTRWIAIAVAGASLALAAALSTSSPAAVDSKATISAGHKCLVMTGSGDPAFIKNFNPYTATGLPSGSIVQGAFYEPLIVTGQGGLKPVPWLARSWKWSNGNKTLTLNLARNAKWSDGQRLDSADVVYSFLAGRQDKLMDRVGLTGAGNNIVSVRARGPYKVLVRLKTPDSQFIAATINRLFVVPQHVWSKVNDIANFRNTRPVASGPFTAITRFTAQSYVFGKNPRYWQKGMPKVPCMEYVRAASNDAALALIQSGQVDWTHNFVPNVETAYVAKDRKHFHAFYATTAYPISLTPRHVEVPVQPRPVPQGAQPRNRPQPGVEARRVRVRAADRRDRPERALPQVGDGQEGEGPFEDDVDVQPLGGEEHPHRSRLQLQQRPADRSEGRRGRARHPRHRRVVGLGRVQPDHHQEPARHRDRLQGRARARLGRLAAGCVRDQVPDAALAGRVAGLPLRVLLLEPLAERLRPAWRERGDDRQLVALRRCRRRRRSSTSGR